VTITAGERVPDVQVHIMTDEGPRLVRVLDVLGTGKAVLFAVPGAFTPTCTDYHLPGFIMRADELHAKGVETIACIAVNDAFVMSA
jgi:peroxiredoxin